MIIVDDSKRDHDAEMVEKYQHLVLHTFCPMTFPHGTSIEREFPPKDTWDHILTVMRNKGNLAAVASIGSHDCHSLAITYLNPLQPDGGEIEWNSYKYGERLALIGVLSQDGITPQEAEETIRGIFREPCDRWEKQLIIFRVGEPGYHL